MRHQRDRSLRLINVRIAEFAYGAAIRLAQINAEMRIADPTHHGFPDDERMSRGRNQQYEQLHADHDSVSAAETTAAIGQIFGHAAGMKVTVRIIDRARDRGADITSLVHTKSHFLKEVSLLHRAQ